MLTVEQKEAIARVGAICGEYAISKNTAAPVNPRNPRPILNLVYSDGARIYGTNSSVLFAEEWTIPAGFYTPGGVRVKDSPFLKPLKYENVIPPLDELKEPDKIEQYYQFVNIYAGEEEITFRTDLVKKAADFLNGVYKAYICADNFRLVLKNGYKTAVIAACRA